MPPKSRPRKQNAKGATAPSTARRGRKRNSKMVGQTSVTGAASPFRSVVLPAQNGIVVKSPVFTRFGSAPYSNVAGDYGLRLEFRQPYSNFSRNTATVGAQFVLSGSNTNVGPGSVSWGPVSPCHFQNADAPGFPSPWIGIPRAFVRYRFRSLRFEYVSMAPNTSTGNIVMAYAPDGAAYSTGLGGSAPADRELSKTVEGPVWSPQPLVLEAIEHKGKDDPDAPLFYSQITTGGTTDTTVEQRLCWQGTFFASSTYTVTTPQQDGIIYVSGTVDCYSQASTVETGLRTREERQKEAARTASVGARPILSEKEEKSDAQPDPVQPPLLVAFPPVVSLQTPSHSDEYVVVRDSLSRKTAPR